MRPGGEFSMPAGTVTVLVARPDGSVPRPPHNDLLRQAVTETAPVHAGLPLTDRLPGRGAVAAGFARASDAVACAVAVQRELTANGWPALIAVHTSHPGAGRQPDHGGYPGQGIDRCAGLAGIAWAGQVLLSQASAGLVTDHLPAGADLADLGWHRLADLGPAEHVCSCVTRACPAPSPPRDPLMPNRLTCPSRL